MVTEASDGEHVQSISAIEIASGKLLHIAPGTMLYSSFSPEDMEGKGERMICCDESKVVKPKNNTSNTGPIFIASGITHVSASPGMWDVFKFILNFLEEWKMETICGSLLVTRFESSEHFFCCE